MSYITDLKSFNQKLHEVIVSIFSKFLLKRIVTFQFKNGITAYPKVLKSVGMAWITKPYFSGIKNELLLFLQKNLWSSLGICLFRVLKTKPHPIHS